MEAIKRGDTVTRRSGATTTGTVERVYRNARTGKLRADVLWHNANRRRLGASTPDKRGSILIEALKLVEAQAA